MGPKISDFNIGEFTYLYEQSCQKTCSWAFWNIFDNIEGRGHPIRGVVILLGAVTPINNLLKR